MRVLSTLLTISSLTCLGLQAASFSAVSDFGGTNPSGAWSYGYGADAAMGTPGAAFTAMASFVPGCSLALAADCWTGGNALIQRPTASFSIGTVNVVLGYLTMHPSPELNWSLLAFTAPAAGNYTFSGELIDEDVSGGNGVQVAAVLADGTSLFGTTLAANFSAGPVPINFARALSSGEVVYFAFGANGEFSYDSTGLKLDVASDVQGAAAPVPEPGSFALMLSAAGLLWAVRKRRAR